MPYDGYEPITIEKFGGLNTLIDPTNLPIFASPDCQDVEFIYGLVRTRPGSTSQFSPLANNPTVNYLKTYVTNAQAIRMLALDSLGFFYKENPQGTLQTIITGQSNPLFGRPWPILSLNALGNSVSQFGREYFASSDGKFGLDHPYQYDDTNFDLCSQVGPGVAPSVTDENNSEAILASPNGLIQYASSTIAAGPAGLTQSGFLVTVTLTAPWPTQLRTGDSIQVAGAGVSGYNGTWVITALPSSTTLQFVASQNSLANSGGGTVAYQLVSVVTAGSPALTALFTAGQLALIAGAGAAAYNGTWTIRTIDSSTNLTVILNTFGNAASGAGTITTAGSIVAGVHQVSVMYQTRQGFLTAPAVPVKWTASGGKRAVVSNIPIGPANVVARILTFTASGGASFFYTTSNPTLFSSNMVIADNTTGNVAVDFSDTILLGGTNVDSQFNLIELGDCAGVTAYSSRLFWWGERNKIQNFVNITFDGGTVSPGITPSGWTLDPVSNRVTVGTPFNNGFQGSFLRITGNGGLAIPGLVSQSAYQDYLGNPILNPNVDYSVRVVANTDTTIGPGAIHVNLFSATGGISTVGVIVPANSTIPTEYIAQLTAPLASIPSDLVLRVYVDGTPNLNVKFNVFSIEVFPTAQPYNVTQVRASLASVPEAYNGVTGFLDVAPSNGQAVRAVFAIRNNLYFAKERSLYVTQDDGTNEPNQWSIQEISNKVGTLSVRGVGLGDEWAIIAGQSGVYYFDGGEPQKLSQEIQPTWDAINWAFGHLVDVKVDTKRKRVYIDVPFGTSTVNNRKLTLDYTDGFGDPNPTNTVNIAGIGRKWVPWTGSIVGNSQNLILRADGTQPLFIGNNAGNGKIYGLDLTGTVFTDDGAKINDYWQSGYAQDVGRLDFGYLTANVIGSGSLGIILRKGDQGWLGNVRGWFLNPNGFRNVERQINLTSERMAIRFGSVGVGDHFSMQGIAAYARPSVSAPWRGVNV